MDECESWTMKIADREKVDLFEMGRGRRVSRMLWAAKNTSKYSLDQIKPELFLHPKLDKLMV